MEVLIVSANELTRVFAKKIFSSIAATTCADVINFNTLNALSTRPFIDDSYSLYNIEEIIGKQYHVVILDVDHSIMTPCDIAKKMKEKVIKNKLLLNPNDEGAFYYLGSKYSFLDDLVYFSTLDKQSRVLFKPLNGRKLMEIAKQIAARFRHSIPT